MVLTFIDYRGLNQMICLLDRFFSSVIFCLSLPLAMYLSCSVKPHFCKATWYIGTDCVKTFLFNDIWHTFFYWFWQLFQYSCGVTGIFVDVNWIIWRTRVKIKLCIKENYYSQIGLDCYSRTKIFEYFQNSFLLTFCLWT